MRSPLLGIVLLVLGSVAPRPAGAAQDPAAGADTAAVDAVAPDTGASDTVGGGADPEPVSVSQEAEDERIRADLQAIFDRVPSLSGIDVTVSAGVVTLSGEVPDGEAETRAVELAEGREGVVFVDGDGLQPATAGDRLEDVWSRLREKAGETLALLPLLAVAFVIVAAFSLLARAVGRRGLARFFPRANPFVIAMLQRLAQFVLVVLGLVIALDLLDATALVGAVVGTAGLAGLALGFAFKDIAENYLAGVILSFRHPFEKNDAIRVGEHEGKVVRLTGRETILMTLDGNHVQIPNAIVFREPMLNYTRNPRRRFTIEVGVAGDSVLSRALDAGVDVLRGMKGVTNDPPPDGIVWGFGDSTTTLRFTAWVDQRSADWLRVRSEAFRLVKLGLEEAGVELPAPEHIVHLPEGAKLDVPSEERPARAHVPGGERREETESAEQRDVSVDLALEEQIAEDRRATGDEDLLDGETNETGGPATR